MPRTANYTSRFTGGFTRRFSGNPNHQPITLSLSNPSANTLTLSWNSRIGVALDFDIIMDGSVVDTIWGEDYFNESTGRIEYPMTLGAHVTHARTFQIADDATGEVKSNIVSYNLGLNSNTINFLDRVIAKGRYPNYNEAIAWNQFSIDTAADGTTSFIGDLIVPTWQDAGANRVKWLSSTDATYTGSANHTTNRWVQFSSNGYCNWNQTVASLAWSPSGCGIIIGVPTAIASNAAVLDFGASDSGGINPMQGGLAFTPLSGHFFDAGVISARTTATATGASVGIHHFARYSTANSQIARYDSGGDTILATKTDNSGGSFAGDTFNLVFGGRNLAGSVDSQANRPYCAMGWTLGSPSLAQLSLIRQRIYELYQRLLIA
jgi:hypothetical protein